MGTRARGDLEKYLRQQLDLGFEDIYLPYGSTLNMSAKSGAEAVSPRKSVAEKSPKVVDNSTKVVDDSTKVVDDSTKVVDNSTRAANKTNQKELPALPIERFAEASTLGQLASTIKDCRQCKLWKERTNVVFGDGDAEAEIMFIGEAPGRDEDLQGKPFVGRAGKLLNKMLNEVGLKREDVYIANILKSRPPNNRDPEPDEVAACEPYLHAQIKLIKPKVICSLGRIAAQTLLRTKMTLGEMRGRWFDYQGTKLMVTFHPAAVLRAMDNYTKSIEDLNRLIREAEKGKS